MSGWCLAASKRIFDKLELKQNNNMRKQIFCEDFFVYFEDTDLSFRARQLKIPMIITAVPVIHFGKQSSSQLNTHKLYTQARVKFLNKWK